MFIQQAASGEFRVVTSASDLTSASLCEFAFLRRADVKFGRDVVVPEENDAMRDRAARLGDAHEERRLRGYLNEFGDAAVGEGAGVVSIPRPAAMTAEALTAVATETGRALRGGADIVFQAVFFDEEQRPPQHELDLPISFIGFADFLAKTANGAYEVQDTKLARRAKVPALLQLAAYAEQLERIGVPVAPTAVLILGDGALSRHHLADIAPVFRARRERLHEILRQRMRAVGPDGRRESAEAIAWGDASVAACGRCEVCGPEVERSRDPLLIAGIRGVQRERLIAGGFDTIDKVALACRFDGDTGVSVVDPGPEGLAPQVFERLALQAAVQTESETQALPAVRVVDAPALAAIPAAQPGDIFFDFEGDPLFREAGDDDRARWGIDYLFGWVDSEEKFHALWAHDLEAEKRALEEFIAYLAERRKHYPAMKVYHFAPYERTHLLSIAARHGTCEQEVDELLREHVLVDLYPIVRRALRIGSRSYSIKKLEPLYMGAELRDEDGVTSGAESVTEYAEASAQLSSQSSATRAEGQRRLDAIADYNRYDCVSTLRLRNWLLSIAAAHEVTPYPPSEYVEPESALGELSATAAALASHALRADTEQDRQAAALAGSAIDYHQREQKAFWWSHFARLVDPIEDWADTRDVMVVDAATSDITQNWHRPPRARVDRRRLVLRGELAAGSSIKPGNQVYLLYAYPAPFLQHSAQPGARGVRTVKVIEVHDDAVTVEENLPAGADHFETMPEAMAPGPPPPAGQQKGAIEEWGSALAGALDHGHFLADPVVDIMRRTPPRLRHGASLCDPASPEAFAAGGGRDDMRMIGAVTKSVQLLDHSALAVQGPPGTGKTFLAARVIKLLVEEQGWHIGVVAQSHRVVEHLLEQIVAAGLSATQVGKVPQGGSLAEGAPLTAFTALARNGQSRFISEHRENGRGSVTGGTAWDFSHPGRYPRKSLDLLVIDEAGQFSLAPTIAASLAAERLLLLGDPQQLPQVTQGTHPEPVDTSALGWLLGDAETLPDGSGYFLAETRRMRPELTRVVSELAYAGRLNAHESTSMREVIGCGAPGMHWVPVQHRGNSTHSVEEAREVVRIVRQALDCQLRENSSQPRELTANDLIVVAAYNAQVECVQAALTEAGLADVRVGTVDRFQGQEAVIAIVTLAASSPEDVPRGLEFLLMRNRLNVAISRAQWSAFLISSDRLGSGLPGSAEGVAALSGYLRLTEVATPGSVETW